MAFIKVDVVAEMRKLAAGKPTRVCAQTIAVWALGRIQQPPKTRVKRVGDSVDFLDRLFKLEDPRGL